MLRGRQRLNISYEPIVSVNVLHSCIFGRAHLWYTTTKKRWKKCQMVQLVSIYSIRTCLIFPTGAQLGKVSQLSSAESKYIDNVLLAICAAKAREILFFPTLSSAIVIHNPPDLPSISPRIYTLFVFVPCVTTVKPLFKLHQPSANTFVDIMKIVATIGMNLFIFIYYSLCQRESLWIKSCWLGAQL